MAAALPQSRPPLVLLASAEEWEARPLEGVLGQHGYAVLRARTLDQALDLAYSARPDAVVIAADLPGDGIELCARLRMEERVTSATPVIVTAAAGNTRAVRNAAYAAGAWEFCAAPIDFEELLPKLDNFVQVKQTGDRLQHAALIEPETGLYTLEGLLRRAREIGAEARRRHAPVGCVAFALQPDPPPREGFALGRGAIAERVGRICRDTIRGSDVAGRLADNEFAIIASETSLSGAARLAERLRGTVEAEPAPGQGTFGRLHINVAIAAVPDLAESPVDVVELLYQATSGLRHAQAADASHPPPAGSPSL